MQPLKNVVFRDSSEFIEKIDRIAEERGISRSDVVREYLRAQVNEKDGAMLNKPTR
jgi:metal-responsive CopG/Arc/MetJ family transcriptional regulator